MNEDISNYKLVSVDEGFNRGNMFDNLFWPYKYIADVHGNDEREKLLLNIQKYSFASHEMNLYLDLNPDDVQAIGLYNQYKDEEDRLIKEYESKYGKICLGINENNTWDWIKSPWPWERI